MGAFKRFVIAVLQVSGQQGQQHPLCCPEHPGKGRERGHASSTAASADNRGLREGRRCLYQKVSMFVLRNADVKPFMSMLDLNLLSVYMASRILVRIAIYI